MVRDFLYMCEWENQPTEELIAFVEQYHPRGRIQGAEPLVVEPPQAFKYYYEGLLWATLGFDILRWKVWTSINTPNDIPDVLDPQWLRGFPHVHKHGEAISMLQYLQVSDGGGELVLYPSSPLRMQVIEPYVGLSVVFSADIEHAVRCLVGNTDRLALIVTGWLE